LYRTSDRDVEAVAGAHHQDRNNRETAPTSLIAG
jgi:hypothetical protein